MKEKLLFRLLTVIIFISQDSAITNTYLLLQVAGPSAPSLDVSRQDPVLSCSLTGHATPPMAGLPAQVFVVQEGATDVVVHSLDAALNSRIRYVRNMCAAWRAPR